MAAADRAASLARIAAVQADMVKLTEWKLAAVLRRRREIEHERSRLADFVSGERPLGAPLAAAALRTSKALEGRGAAVDREEASLRATLDTLRRREHVAARMTKVAADVARREREASDLAETMAAWLARGDASLP